jgi:hypothetical protein
MAGVKGKVHLMETDTRTPAELRAAGPFVSATGNRIGVSVLSQREIPGLLEFFDYRAARGLEFHLLGEEDSTRGAIANTPERAFSGNAVLGVKSSRDGLIRGVLQYRRASAGGARVGFLLDDAIESLDLAIDVLERLIDNARAAGVTQLILAAPEPSTLFSALRASGYPMLDGDVPGERVLTILRSPALTL